MRRVQVLILVGAAATCGCKKLVSEILRQSAAEAPSAAVSGQTLPEARRGFKTEIVRQEAEHEAVATPPPQEFRIAEYPAPNGNLPSYLTVAPEDGKRHAAIVWITGGDSNSIGEVWGTEVTTNEQSARAFRKADIVMMFPSLRGGNLSKAKKESFLGEVDDVLSAAEYLAKVPYVDPTRIFLGGHSTGGTLALLVAESSDLFRGVFAFGPVDEASRYPESMLTCALNEQELRMRSPVHWLHGVKSPTYVFEGAQKGNSSAVRILEQASKNPQLHFEVVPGHDHFSILAPYTKKLAQAVAADTGAGRFVL